MVVLDVGVVGRVVLEGDEEHVVAGLLHGEAPVEHDVVVRGGDVVAAEVLARVAVGAVLDLPLSGVVVGIVVVEEVAERGLAVVIQHGHVVAETGLDPVAGVDVALGEGEEGGGLSDHIIPLLGLAHHLNVQMGTG